MTNKQVQAFLRDFRGRNPLYRHVASEIVRDSENCYGKNLHARLTSRLDDISRGLSSGVVSSMIHCTDTVRFFKRYQKHIAALLVELQQDTGEPWVNLINGFDMDDLFVRDVHNQNLLAWAAYEMVASRIREELTI